MLLSYIMRTEICSVAECRDTSELICQGWNMERSQRYTITSHYYSSPEANRFIGHNEDGSNDLLVALMDDVGE